MKIYLNANVFDSALERINYIFDEFDNVVVSFSGGKDSTAILNLALKVAEERNRLPLKVFFLDQEAEWELVINYVRRVMNDPRVDPMWLQVPIRLFNATSYTNSWLMCWREDDQWMRDKEDISFKENVYGTDRFHKMFKAVIKHHFPNKRVALLGGVRAEESPNRRAGLTTGATYKHITYGQIMDKKTNQYVFNPLYDWSYTDIWTSIHKNKWDYCKVYDEFYRYGVAPIKMRISNLHHETAVDQLFYLQEIEPNTWNLLQKRLSGINQARHMNRSEMFAIKELPYMFKDWKEYRDYLLDNLIKDGLRPRFQKKFQDMDRKFREMAFKDDMYKEHINTILSNDWEFIKISNFLGRPHTINYVKHINGKKVDWNRPEKDLKYIKPEFRGEKFKTGATNEV